MSTQIVINARTGVVLLDGATVAQFDRWYDHHCFWRAPRALEEVNPELRERYLAASSDIHFLVQDE